MILHMPPQVVVIFVMIVVAGIFAARADYKKYHKVSTVLLWGANFIMMGAAFLMINMLYAMLNLFTFQWW